MRNTSLGEDVQIKLTTFNSKALESEVNLSIYNPSEDESKQALDAIFLLDGDAFFNYTTATVDYYTKSMRAPPLMVIGIEVEDRKTSFTPPTTQTIDSNSPAFTTCLRDEIIPYIDGLGSPTHHKTLIGHSLGGLYVLSSIFVGDRLFNAWVAFSPSLSLHVKYLENLLETQRESTVGTLFLASDGDSPDVTRFAQDLVKSLDARNHGQLRIRHRIYPEADHFTIFVKAFPDALDFQIPVLAHRHDKVNGG